FGHMAICKKYGGTVTRAGILLMVFTPMPYADTTSAWGFRERYKRLAVGFGGMYVEMFLAALAAVVWAKSGGGIVSDLAYNAMLVGSISTLVFNLNPLLRFDGYFILTDLSGIANLYQRSLKQLGYLWEKYLFGLKRELSPANDRAEAWVLALYGVFGGVYRFALFASILFFVWDRFLLLGVIMGLICLVAWVVKPSFKLVKYLGSSPKLHLRRAKAVGIVVGLAVALIFALRWIPLPQSIRAPGILEAQRYATLSSASSGRIVEFLSEPGALVKAGQALARMEDRELELSLREMEAQLVEGRARVRQALADNPSSRQVLAGYLNALEERAAELKEREKGLIVRAPIDGFWIAPDIEEAIGVWLPRGTSMGEVLDTSVFEFRVQVPVDRVSQIVSASNGPAVVRLDGQPWTRLDVGDRILVAAAPEAAPREGDGDSQPSFEFRGTVEKDEEATLLHGLAGQIRFELPAQSIWQQGKRMWRQFLEKRESASSL
ncbi:MAG: biotin/lipoyl-binding protein, partial [Verrucomicrobiota bacterium]